MTDEAGVTVSLPVSEIQHGVVVISLAFVVDARHALGRLVTWLD